MNQPDKGPALFLSAFIPVHLRLNRFLTAFALLAACGYLLAQGLDRATLLKQPVDAWPTYNGDYSARRFSPLKQINSTNVHQLSLLWATRFTGSPAAAP